MDKLVSLRDLCILVTTAAAIYLVITIMQLASTAA